jgi:hypothetical protein
MYCILELRRGITIPQIYMAKRAKMRFCAGILLKTSWNMSEIGTKNCQYNFGTGGIFGETEKGIEVNKDHKRQLTKFINCKIISIFMGD